MSSYMVIHWEGSHLVQLMDMRQAPPMVVHMVIYIESLSSVYW